MPSRTQTWYDREGGVVHKYTHDTAGRITRERLSPNGRAICEQNRRLQIENPTRSLDWGRLSLQIPENDYHRLMHKYPELKCWDHEVKSRAWKRFMASDESRPYRVREKL